MSMSVCEVVAVDYSSILRTVSRRTGGGHVGCLIVLGPAGRFVYASGAFSY